MGQDGQVVAIGGINTDISDQKETEENLKASERQLRTITDSLPVLIAYFDSGQRYRFVNKIAEEWHAVPTEEIIGQTVASKFLAYPVYTHSSPSGCGCKPDRQGFM